MRDLDLCIAQAKSPTRLQESRLAIADSSTSAPTAENNGASHQLSATTSELGRQHSTERDPATIDASSLVVLSKQPGVAAFTKMDDNTQLSSLSPTQENPVSVYAQFAFQSANASGPRAADASEARGSGHTNVDHGSQEPHMTKHHSTVDDSTAHTYGEHDTGHVNFDGFAIEENPPNENSAERGEPVTRCFFCSEDARPPAAEFIRATNTGTSC